MRDHSYATVWIGVWAILHSVAMGQSPTKTVHGDTHKPIQSSGGRVPPSGLQLGALLAEPDNSESMIAFTAFVHDNWDVFTWDFVEDHAPIRRTTTPYDESHPSLAPDHSFCVYESVDGKLWRLSFAAGAAPERLPFGSGQHLDMHPAVSPDGRRVVLATSLDRTTDDTDLIVFDLSSGSFGKRLKLLAYQHYPSWSPDGRHVAFGNLHGRLWTGQPISEIWVMRTDSPWARQLTLLDSISISPDWSPDGQRVAFASNRSGNFDIWMIDPFTRACGRLTEHPAADTAPTFAPNGQSIIFVSTRGGCCSLWRIDLRTRQTRAVTPFGSDTSIPIDAPDWQ